MKSNLRRTPQLAAALACLAGLITLGSFPRAAQAVTVGVIYVEAPGDRRPSASEVQAFRGQYRFIIQNSDAELADLLPRAIVAHAERGATLSVFDEFARFQQRRPDIPLSVTLRAWNGAYTRLYSAVQHDPDGPDVLMMPSTWCSDFIIANLLLGLDEQILAGHIDLGRQYDDPGVVLTACQDHRKRRLYGLPGTLDLRQLYVWRLLQREGRVVHLLDRPAEQLRTVGTFTETLAHLQDTLARDLPDEKVRPMALPNYADDWSKVHTFVNWLWLFGARIFDEDSQRFDFTGSEAQDAVNALLAIAPYVAITDKGLAQVEEDFVAGKQVIHVGVPGTATRLREALGEHWNDQVAVVSMPEGPGGRWNFLGGTYWVMTSLAARHGRVGQAWELVRHLALDPDAQQRFALAEGHLPATREALRALAEKQPQFKPAIDGIHDGRMLTRFIQASEVERKLSLDHLHQFWIAVGGGRPAEARALLRSLEDELNRRPPERSAAAPLLLLLAVAVAVVIFLLRRRKHSRAAVPKEREPAPVQAAPVQVAPPAVQVAPAPAQAVPAPAPAADELLGTVDRALDAYERDPVPSAAGRDFGLICAPGGKLERLIERELRKFAASDLSLLILGETGTGKEVVARGLHEHSLRAGKKYLPTNIAIQAREGNLLQATLYGQVANFPNKGDQARPGIFEDAGGGTVFLDEIGVAPNDIQISLLRPMREKQISRLGANQVTRVDFRLIAATNVDLADDRVRQERGFQDDLFHRFDVCIRLEALRDRREDILYLVDHFNGGEKAKVSIDGQARVALVCYSWPGNVAEVSSFLRRASALGLPVLRLSDLTPEMRVHYDSYLQAGGQGGTMAALKRVVSRFYEKFKLPQGREAEEALLIETLSAMKDVLVARGLLPDGPAVGSYLLLKGWLGGADAAKKALVELVFDCRVWPADPGRQEVINRFLGTTYRNISADVTAERKKRRLSRTNL